MAARLEKLSEQQVLEEAMSLVEQRGAAAQKKEVDPSNLPYLYRNPAI